MVMLSVAAGEAKTWNSGGALSDSSAGLTVVTLKKLKAFHCGSCVSYTAFLSRWVGVSHRQRHWEDMRVVDCSGTLGFCSTARRQLRAVSLTSRVAMHALSMRVRLLSPTPTITRVCITGFDPYLAGIRIYFVVCKRIDISCSDYKLIINMSKRNPFF